MKLLLEKANEFGIDSVLITCRENNIASKQTMESFIGHEDSLTDSNYPGIKEFRYWIDIKENIRIKTYKKI